MNIINIHERKLTVDRSTAGALLDSLSSTAERLWPQTRWPAMRFDQPLGVGATGGHGPIRYRVQSYTPGERVVFRFTGPPGLIGSHFFELIPQGDSSTMLRHTVAAESRGTMIAAWPLVFGPLHDALLEDALATAQASLGLTPEITPWSPWVWLLRRLLGGRKTKSQRIAPQPPVSG